MSFLLRHFIFTVLLFHVNQAAFAQNWEWAKSSSGDEWVRSYGVAVDTKGYSYVVGTFSKTAKFGASTLTSDGPRSISAFLTKFDAIGRVVWAKKIGGSEYEYGLSITVDAQDNVYLTGHITIPTSIPDNYQLKVFISKFNQNGNQLWTKINGASGGGWGSDIKADANGNCYVTGRFSGPVTFGDKAVTGRKQQNSFVVKYDPSGKALWAIGIDDTPVFSDNDNGIGFDAEGNVYLTGSFSETTTIGHITLQGNSHMGNNYEDMFIAKFDSNGNVVWAKQAGGNGFDFARDIAVDAKGNSYIAGTYNPNSAIDGYNSAAFIAKYNTNGELLWTKNAADSKITDKNINGGYALDFDATGNIYLLGVFVGSATFGNTTLEGEQKRNLFVAKFNPNGEALWATQGGSDGIDIALDAKGNGYVTGSFEYPIAFDAFALDLNSKPVDMFLAKFSSTDTPLDGRAVFIPNIITPNGDGLNDTFVPRIPDVAAELKVYNRWGKLVYEHANYQNSWDGGNLSAGNYLYLLTSLSGNAWKGWVEICR